MLFRSRVKILSKPKHLDTEEVVSKVKELLQIEEHSKELGGVIRTPEITHKSFWGGAPRHSRIVDFSEDEEEDEIWFSSLAEDNLSVGKADKVPSQDGNPPVGMAGRLSPHPPDQGERRPGVPAVPGNSDNLTPKGLT